MNMSIINSITKVITKNSSTILVGLSVTGLVTSIIMAVKATPKALENIFDEQFDRCEVSETTYERYTDYPLTKMEIVKATYKCYIPTAIMGGLTIGCMIGAHSINLRRNAALAGAYSLAETTLKEYQAKVIETVGKNKERQIKDDIAKDRVDKDPVSKKEVIITGSGETLCYDALSGRYFKSDVETIKKALNRLSHRLMSDMYISLSEVYSELDMAGTKLGDSVGWTIEMVGDDLISPDFSTQLSDDGRPCLVLDFEVQPKYCDRDC